MGNGPSSTQIALPLPTLGIVQNMGAHKQACGHIVPTLYLLMFVFFGISTENCTVWFLNFRNRLSISDFRLVGKSHYSRLRAAFSFGVAQHERVTKI